MPFYESTFIVRPDVSSQQVEAITTAMTELVQASGGTVPKTEYWGLKSLAYRIKKNRKGHYVLLNLDAPPAAVNELERNLKINEDVLRVLTIRVDALEASPSAMMQARHGRDDRDRRRDGRSRYEDEAPPERGPAPERSGERE
ncbi:MAG: 30S ribosomal protein S6 [Alphaproteobacteria bacterium]